MTTRTHELGRTYKAQDFAGFINSVTIWQTSPRGGSPARYVNGHRVHGSGTFARYLRKCTSTQEEVHEYTIEIYLLEVNLSLQDFQEWCEYP